MTNDEWRQAMLNWARAIGWVLFAILGVLLPK